MSHVKNALTAPTLNSALKHEVIFCVQGVNSPLLANLYMRRFILGWKRLGYAQRYQAHIVNFADDFVICCRGTAAEAEVAMARMMAQLKLTVNRNKTHRCRLPEQSFDFVGYTFERCYSPQTGRAYIGTCPSKKSIRRVCREISALTARRCVLAEPQNRVDRLNRLTVGWANYFSLGPVSKAYEAVDAHARFRLRVVTQEAQGQGPGHRTMAR